MPGLTDDEEEYQEAKSRLLPGESLDRDEFRRIADLIRAGVAEAGPPRPVDLTLLLRERVETDFQEVPFLDSLGMLHIHPRWRRVLGFACFDDSDSLVQGQSYQYRVRASFPESDLADRVLGFHSAPTGTVLPARRRAVLQRLHADLLDALKEAAPASSD